MKGYTFDGMDFFNCYAGFEHVFKEVQETTRPVLVEVVTERFRGHSISDPALYRSKDELKHAWQEIRSCLFKTAEEAKMIDEENYKAMDKEQKEIVLAAMKFAEESPWPDPITLEEDVFAP